MVTINGEVLDIADKTVAQYLSENKYEIKRVAVELNGEILPKSKYEETALHDGDSVEIVCFVGGG